MKVISHNIIKPLGKHLFYAIKMLHCYYFCYSYHPNINNHMKSLMCTEH